MMIITNTNKIYLLTFLLFKLKYYIYNIQIKLKFKLYYIQNRFKKLDIRVIVIL